MPICPSPVDWRTFPRRVFPAGDLTSGAEQWSAGLKASVAQTQFSPDYWSALVLLLDAESSPGKHLHWTLVISHFELNNVMIDDITLL